MLKQWIMAVGILSVCMASPSPTYSASQDECAIWLCLPGGFPSGCGAAKSAFRKRIRKGKSPLPKFSSCAVGSTGSYRLGREYFHDCPAGTRSESIFNGISSKYARVCLPQTKGCRPITPRQIEHFINMGRSNHASCDYTFAKKRNKWNYIDMNINGDDLGRFFY